MLKRFFKFAERMKNENKFLFDIANHNPLWLKFKKFWKFIKFHSLIKQEIVNFYAQNADRVATVANMLADEKSKITYLAMIKFRQTHSKKDFPTVYYERIQYFIEELQFGKDEIFIDCGAFDGDTISTFLERCPDYKQIIAFEPDTNNFEKLNEKYGNNTKIKLIFGGAYNKDGEVLFYENGSMSEKWQQASSRIIDGFDNRQENISKIQVKAIDNLDLEKVSFIKMDIEGAEMNALKGAEKTIIRDKPKLAICIYHSNEDMICITEYIHNLVPEYKLYIRHHTEFPYLHETVLYALL